jgi:hypothetical protein
MSKARGEIQLTDADGNVTATVDRRGVVVPAMTPISYRYISPAEDAAVATWRPEFTEERTAPTDERMVPRRPVSDSLEAAIEADNDPFDALVETLPEAPGPMATTTKPRRKRQRVQPEGVALMLELSKLDHKVYKLEGKLDDANQEREVVRAKLRAIFASDDGGQAKAVRE